MNIQEIEQALIADCEAAILFGYHIESNLTYSSPEKKCCPIGTNYALGHYTRGASIFSVAELVYGMTEHQTVAFIDGFDNENVPVVNPNSHAHMIGIDRQNRLNRQGTLPYYEMGQRLRKMFVK